MPSVLLLGANSDMAISVARKYAQQGFEIILASRNQEALLPLVEDIKIRYKVPAKMVVFDALDFTGHKTFYQQLGISPDITVCVFGYLGEQEKAVADWKESEKIIQTNYTGAVSILNIIAEDYASKKKGVIVGISSVAGERGRQSNYIYGSAKAGFTAYLSGLRNRLYKYNVHVVTVLPGFVNTKMTAELNLPPLLTASPQQVADAVEKAVRKKQNIVYVKWFWKWIMMIIKSIPENMFKKKNL
jgi:short-subunit dehydrogenase